jgi:GTPase SAR1 family protein
MEQMQELRQYIREVLRKIKKDQKQELRKEVREQRELRKLVRVMLKEKQDTVQHSSTGINALEKLLGSIVPILETGYKDLKTDAAQRKSFKAHILRAIQNLLSTASVYFSADKKGGEPATAPAPALALPPTDVEKPETELKEQDEEAGPETDPQFIDINKDKKGKEEKAKKDPVNAFQTVQGEDLTGRNFALETFKKIQKQILETYSLLSNEQDREIFYDYLLTNTKLYFDKFETELEATPAEPTTPEYEAEKAKKDASLQPVGQDVAGVEQPAGLESAAEELPEPEV